MIRIFRQLFLSEKGATAIEYGLIVALIGIAIMVALGNFADTTTNMWNTVANEVVSSS